MAPFSKYYDTIDEIIEHIRLALIGPIEEKETMESDYPLSRYSLGILWGQSKTESGYANAVNETDDTGELFEDETQDNAWNVNQSQYQPSSLGISFSAFPGSTLEVSFSYGVYHHSINEVGTGEDAFQKHIYAREPKYFSSFVKIPDRVCSIQHAFCRYRY